MSKTVSGLMSWFASWASSGQYSSMEDLERMEPERPPSATADEAGLALRPGKVEPLRPQAQDKPPRRRLKFG